MIPRPRQGGRPTIRSDIFQRLLDQSPIRGTARGAMGYALSAADLDRVFADAAGRQYTRSFLFSAPTDLMSSVVCRIRPSVHAAFQADPGRLGVSVRAGYDTLSRLEPGVTEAVLAHTAARLAPVVRRLVGRRPGGAGERARARPTRRGKRRSQSGAAATGSPALRRPIQVVTESAPAHRATLRWSSSPGRVAAGPL